jgi:hypothetical protein
VVSVVSLALTVTGTKLIRLPNEELTNGVVGVLSVNAVALVPYTKW